MNIIPTSRDLTALRIGRSGPAFIDIAPATDGVCLTASNGHTVHVIVAGDCDRAVRIPFDAFVRAARLGGKAGFSLDAKTCTAGGYRFPVTLSEPSASQELAPEFFAQFDEATATKMLSRVMPAMSDDDSRPHIRCLHLVRRDGVLAAESTNGHILARMTIPSEGRDFDVMVPAEAVRSVARAKGDLSLVIGRFPTIPNVRSRLVFVRGKTTVACEGVANVGMTGGKSLSPVEFPEMAVCIPTTWERSVTVDAAELRRVVTRLGNHTAENRVPAVRMETRDGLALSTAADYDGGRLTAPTLPCEGTMKRAVTIQARYILATCGTKGTVTFRFSGDMDPVRIENDGVVCITMPMRM